MTVAHEQQRDLPGNGGSSPPNKTLLAGSEMVFFFSLRNSKGVSLLLVFTLLANSSIDKILAGLILPFGAKISASLCSCMEPP